VPEHIGIVACSAEGAALCLRTICAEGAALLGPHAHPEISMHAHSLSEYVQALEAGDVSAVARLMLESSRKLASAGADFLICPDNTIHQAFALVAPQSPLPWLHIADAVTAQAQQRGFRRVGILGTRYLVESPVYPERLAACGIEAVLPAPAARLDVHRAIMEELVYGTFDPQTVSRLQDIILELKTNGCDAAVLACTELPLVLDETNSPLPLLDSTRLLARSALRKAINPDDSTPFAGERPRDTP
jgi:aspartate racemase